MKGAVPPEGLEEREHIHQLAPPLGFDWKEGEGREGEEKGEGGREKRRESEGRLAYRIYSTCTYLHVDYTD